MCFFFSLLWTAGLLLAQVRLAINLTIKGQAYPEVSSIDKTSCLGFYSEVASHCGVAHRQCSGSWSKFSLSVDGVQQIRNNHFINMFFVKTFEVMLSVNKYPSIHLLASTYPCRVSRPTQRQTMHTKSYYTYGQGTRRSYKLQKERKLSLCVALIHTFVFSLSGRSYFEALIVL